MHHWWSKCRKSPGFTPNLQAGRGEESSIQPDKPISAACLQSERRAVKITALNVQPQASPRHMSALQQQFLLLSLSVRGGMGTCDTPDHTRKGMCGPKPCSSRAPQVAVAGSLIKATLLVLTHLFPLPSCPFLQSAPCTKPLFPGLHCRPKAASHTRGAAPVLASGKDRYLHWLRRGFHPPARQ